MLGLGASRKEAIPIWGLAALGAVALHLACVAFAVAHMQFAEADEALGARAIDIGLELASPRGDPTDLPAGPDAEATAASPEMVEQKAVVKENDLPQAVPTETDDPDRVVSPTEAKKPQKEDPEVATAQAAPSTLSVATEASAMPTSTEVQEAPRSVAPVQGTGRRLGSGSAGGGETGGVQHEALRRRPTMNESHVASFTRHGPACPGHLFQHCAATGGPDTCVDWTRS